MFCAKSVIKQNKIENGYKIVERKETFKQTRKIKMFTLKEQNTSSAKKCYLVTFEIRRIFGFGQAIKKFE